MRKASVVVSIMLATLMLSTLLGLPATAENAKENDGTAKIAAGGAGVTPLTVQPGKIAEVTGNLKAGKKIALDWAEKSTVACFPATRFEMFDGKHVMYRVSMPPKSSMKIQLTASDKSKLINLYALRQQASGSQPVPPNVDSAISAEASYPKYARTLTKVVKNPDDGIRKVDFDSLNQPYSILIGVAGANGLEEGEYKLSVDLQSR